MAKKSSKMLKKNPEMIANICREDRETHREEDLLLIQRTIELAETKSELEDKYTELESLNKEITRQNRELIRKTLDLTETKAQLEDKNLEFGEANKEIMNMLKIKTEFINQAAHDLRTPLTPILTLLPLLKSELKSESSLHNLEVIERNATYLNHIVNDLLSLIKLQTSKLEGIFEECDLIQLIDEVLANNEVVFNNHKVAIKKKYEKHLPKVSMDKFRITEVLQNFFSNAVKFTPPKGAITVAVKKTDKFINVRITDTGIGMSKKTLGKLFTEFFRADASRHTEGAGLGLSICKRIIEKHSGSIWAESKGRGKGSSFIFELPLK